MTTLAAVIIGLVMVGLVTVVIVASSFPVRCARCPGRPRLRPVESAALDALLSPIEQTERRIGATRFVLRACPACRTTDLERRPVPGLFASCRRCTALAARQRHVTVRAATYGAEGLVETRAACEHCHTIDVTSAVTPRLHRPPRRRLRVGGGHVHVHAYGYDLVHERAADHSHDAGEGLVGRHAHDVHSAPSDGHPPVESYPYDASPPHCHGDLLHEDGHASHDTSSFDSGSSSCESGDDA